MKEKRGKVLFAEGEITAKNRYILKMLLKKPIYFFAYLSHYQ
jgi:hypothetical protein